MRPAARVWAAIVLVIGTAPLWGFFLAPRGAAPDEGGAMFVFRIRGFVVLATLLGGSAYLLATGRARPGALAISAAGLVLAAMPVLSGIFGLEPRLRGTLLVQPALFLAIALLPRISMRRLARWVEATIIFYAYGSLVAAVVWPERALQTGYTAGWLPGLHYRLHGIGAHANGLAPFMVVYFLVRWFAPGRARGVTVHDATALAVLVLTQSKMAWAMLLLAGVLALAQNRRLRFPWARFPVLAFTLAMAVVLSDVGDSIVGRAAGVLPVAAESQAYTLTGRTQVWRETMYLWEQNPWFGYGPGLWDRNMRERYRDVLGWAPPAAHSQFYQTLGESGLVGIAGLGCYLATWVGAALALGGRHPIVPAFAVVLVARGIAEPTLSPNLESAFVVHFWAVAFLALALRERRPCP